MWAPPLAFRGFVLLASAGEKTLKQTSLSKKGADSLLPKNPLFFHSACKYLPTLLEGLLAQAKNRDTHF
jgi:hypothetical protein